MELLRNWVTWPLLISALNVFNAEICQLTQSELFTHTLPQGSGTSDVPLFNERAGETLFPASCGIFPSPHPTQPVPDPWQPCVSSLILTLSCPAWSPSPILQDAEGSKQYTSSSIHKDFWNGLPHLASE